MEKAEVTMVRLDQIRFAAKILRHANNVGSLEGSDFDDDGPDPVMERVKRESIRQSKLALSGLGCSTYYFNSAEDCLDEAIRLRP